MLLLLVCSLISSREGKLQDVSWLFDFAGEAAVTWPVFCRCDLDD